MGRRRGTRGRGRGRRAGSTREINSYFFKQTSQQCKRMESPPYQPPAKKAKMKLSIPIPPSTEVIPPSLPTPSPPPFTSPSLLAPNIEVTSSSSSPTLPPTPTSPLSPRPTDDLETILILRCLHREMLTPAIPVELFSKTQECVASCYLDQLDTMGMPARRLDILLDYLEFAVSPSRSPPADILTRLWNLTTDDEMVQRVGPERIQRAGSLFRSLLSLRPPWISPLVQEQYSLFLQSLSNRDNGPFSIWTQIRQLLSPSVYRHFHCHVEFLIDLLLSDLWASLQGWGCERPLMFVSVFWKNLSSTASPSLPVRQLLDTITHSILSYTTNSETEFLALQSQMVLLYMVMTHCGLEIVPDLLSLALKLNTDQFNLFAVCLHPSRLVSSLALYRTSQNGVRGGDKRRGRGRGRGRRGGRGGGDLISSAIKLSDIINQLQMTSLASQPVQITIPSAVNEHTITTTTTTTTTTESISANMSSNHTTKPVISTNNKPNGPGRDDSEEKLQEATVIAVKNIARNSHDDPKILSHPSSSSSPAPLLQSNISVATQRCSSEGDASSSQPLSLTSSLAASTETATPVASFSLPANQTQPDGNNQSGSGKTFGTRQFYKRSAVSVVVATPLTPFYTPNSNQPLPPLSPPLSSNRKQLGRKSPVAVGNPAKRLKLGCENCDAGVSTCHRCIPLKSS